MVIGIGMKSEMVWSRVTSSRATRSEPAKGEMQSGVGARKSRDGEEQSCEE